MRSERPLRTFDTVLGETPASAATWWIVTPMVASSPVLIKAAVCSLEAAMSIVDTSVRRP
jgi:hypothetical protein